MHPTALAAVHGAVFEIQCGPTMRHQEPPLVSVAIPAHNAAQFIAETLDSVLGQTYPAIEVIVVDDGSTDGTAEVLKPYMDRIVYHHQQKGGLGSARNAGIRLARGTFIAWCDADDLCELDRLACQAAYLCHNEQVVAIGSNFSAFETGKGISDPSNASRRYSELAAFGLAGLFPKVEDFDGRDVAWLKAPLNPTRKIYWGDVWGRLLLGNFMHPPTMMIRASACARAGWLEEDLRTNEDWEYITRISRLGPVASIDAALLRYRIHPNQMSSGGSPLGAINCIRVYEKHRRLCADDAALLAEIDVRLAGMHAEASYRFAGIDSRKALRHLFTAARISPREARFLFHLARILMPRKGMQLLRALRRRLAPKNQPGSRYSSG